MTVKCARIKSSAMWLCLSHCLMDNSSQSVGLLFGEKNSRNEVIVYDAIFSDRQPNTDGDIAYSFVHSLGDLNDHSEKLSRKYGKTIYCVGLYHSHAGFSCEPTVHDFFLLKKLAEFLCPDFLLVIFSVCLTPATERWAKYPLHNSRMIHVFDKEAEKMNMQGNFRKKIEILCTKVTTAGKLCLVPTTIRREPMSCQPNSLETLCEFPAKLFEKKKHMFEEEMNKCGDMNNLSTLCELDAKSTKTMELLQITTMYAPLLAMLEFRRVDSAIKQSHLLLKKAQLEDDLKHLKAVIALDQN